jgi:hypothetical protein
VKSGGKEILLLKSLNIYVSFTFKCLTEIVVVVVVVAAAAVAAVPAVTAAVPSAAMTQKATRHLNSINIVVN